MERDIIFIFYVKNQERSKLFYEKVLGFPPVLDVPGMTEFQLNKQSKLGLMPETGIAKILNNKTKHLKLGNGIPRAEMYIYDKNPETKFEKAIKEGAKLISPYSLRDWGDYAGYCSDYDGNILVFAKKSIIHSSK